MRLVVSLNWLMFYERIVTNDSGVADRPPYAVHQDNALISTSKGLSEWGNI